MAVQSARHEAPHVRRQFRQYPGVRLLRCQTRRKRRPRIRSCGHRRIGATNRENGPPADNAGIPPAQDRCGPGRLKRRAIVIAFVLRVNSAEEKISAVETASSGTRIRYQAGGKRSSCRRSPIPSANAFLPNTNTGTSAPSFSASCCNRSRDSPVCHSRFNTISVVAASELPPPSPAAHGQALDDANVHALAAPRLPLQCSCGTHTQVLLCGDTLPPEWFGIWHHRRARRRTSSSP